jgi:phosphatidate cytidylyltransferase
LTALIGVPLLIIIIQLGGVWAWAAVVAAVGIAATLELYNMVARQGKRPPAGLGAAWTVLLILAPIASRDIDNSLLLAGSAGLIASFIWLLSRPRQEGLLTAWSWMLAGVLYIGWLLSHFVALRGVAEGRDWVLLALLATFATDSSAYFVGQLWGTHRLAPQISPAKTVEGAIGGIAGSIAACFILAYILHITITPWQTSILGVIIGVFAQLGDLAESLLKRNMGAKDSGSIIPGHGGILDRADSLMFSGAAVYYYVIFIR